MHTRQFTFLTLLVCISCQSGLCLAAPKAQWHPNTPRTHTVKERDALQLDLRRWVVVREKEGAPLVTFSGARFSLSESASWVALTPQGFLVATPEHSAVGVHSIKVRVQTPDKNLEMPFSITVQRAPREPVWKTLPPPAEILSRETFKTDFGPLVSDLDGVALRFSAPDSPEWFQITNEGKATLTPPDSAEGTHRIELKVANDALTTARKWQVRVVHKNYPPVVKGAVEQEIPERTEFRIDLARFVDDPDGDRLEFKILDTPKWIRLEGSVLKAMPRFAHIGKHNAIAEVSDGQAKVQLPVQLTVRRVPRPPVWKESVQRLTLKTRKPFELSLSSLATDLDALPLKFEALEAPAWLQVEKGLARGVPADSDVGQTRVRIQASNGEMPSVFELRLMVEQTNRPPQWSLPKIELGSATAGQLWEGSVAELAQDPDAKDKVTFAVARGPQWLSIDPSGALKANPPRSASGPVAIVLRARDTAGLVAEVPANLQVRRAPEPIAPVALPARLPKAYKGELFTFNLRNWYKNEGLVFKKTRGPGWVRIAPGGEVSGIASEPGAFELEFEVSNGLDHAPGLVKGEVAP